MCGVELGFTLDEDMYRHVPGQPGRPQTEQVETGFHVLFDPLERTSASVLIQIRVCNELRRSVLADAIKKGIDITELTAGTKRCPIVPVDRHANPPWSPDMDQKLVGGRVG